MRFAEKTAQSALRSESLVCVGLDTDTEKLPEGFSGSEGALEFNRSIIQATADLVCAYKPNSAFYEAMGGAGMEVLAKTRAAISSDIPVILDVKRGDIGNTAEKYAVAAYDHLGADAVTVNPYMGFDAVRPFLRPGKCVFVLCLTSNPSASDFQFLESEGLPLYAQVARNAVEWAKDGEVGLVVGASKPEPLRRIRDIIGDMPILIPGIGAQGGDISAVLDAAGGKPGITIINSSRDILYASRGRDFADAARSRLKKLREEIEKLR